MVWPILWCGLSPNLGCMSETWCTRLAENTGRKNRQKFVICAPSYNFVGLYLRNEGTYRQLGKKSEPISAASEEEIAAISSSLAAEIGSVVWGATYIRQGGHLVGHRPTF